VKAGNAGWSQMHIIATRISITSTQPGLVNFRRILQSIIQFINLCPLHFYQANEFTFTRSRLYFTTISGCTQTPSKSDFLQSVVLVPLSGLRINK
jgi:hypothetical protein